MFVFHQPLYFIVYFFLQFLVRSFLAFTLPLLVLCTQIFHYSHSSNSIRSRKNSKPRKECAIISNTNSDIAFWLRLHSKLLQLLNTFHTSYFWMCFSCFSVLYCVCKWFAVGYKYPRCFFAFSHFIWSL